MPDAPDWLKTFGQSGQWEVELLIADESAFVFGELVPAAAGLVNVLTFWSASARVDGAGGFHQIHSMVVVDATVAALGTVATIALSPDRPSDSQGFPPGQLAWPTGEAIALRAIAAPGGGRTSIRVYGLYYTREP